MTKTCPECGAQTALIRPDVGPPVWHCTRCPYESDPPRGVEPDRIKRLTAKESHDSTAMFNEVTAALDLAYDLGLMSYEDYTCLCQVAKLSLEPFIAAFEAGREVGKREGRLQLLNELYEIGHDEVWREWR